MTSFIAIRNETSVVFGWCSSWWGVRESLRTSKEYCISCSETFAIQRLQIHLGCCLQAAAMLGKFFPLRDGMDNGKLNLILSGWLHSDFLDKASIR